MLTLDEWKSSRLPNGRWKRRARQAIRAAVDTMPPEQIADPKWVIRRVDAAYPFIERKYQPYKDWLHERRIFITALGGDPELPSADEVAACMVARDMLEEGRDEATVMAFLDENAPNRLARKCPACGHQSPGYCRNLESMHDITQRALLIVPHEARLVGHLGNGPLFGDRPR